MNKKFFGIDFGTTTTAFCCFDEDTEGYIMFGNEVGHPYHSVIALDKVTGNVAFKGTEAWMKKADLVSTGGLTVVSSVKQRLTSDDIWETNERIWTPEMVAAEILRIGVETIKVKWPDSEAPLEAVVAVPVDFNYEERKAISRAAGSVGIHVTQFVSEPTAALIGCDEDLKEIRNILVFDWGGGTLDVSVLKKVGGKFKELAKGTKRDGGDRIDDQFARWVHNGCDTGIPFDMVEPRNRDRLLARCEQEKRNLSVEKDVKIALPNYHKGLTVRGAITRTEFEVLIKELIDSLLDVMLATLARTGLSAEQIDLALMVGGSSQIPLVKREMEKIFGSRCAYAQNAEWCIAKGAARLAGQPGSYTLASDVGIILSDGFFFPVLRNSEPLYHRPVVVTLGLVEDAREARLIIAEKASGHDGNASLLGAITVPTSGFNFEPIEAIFEVETSLALRVSAVNALTARRLTESKTFTGLKFEYLLHEED
jgi:molecular chaperone DnaK